MKTNKGFIGIGLVVGIVAAIAVATGGYAAWKMRKAHTAEVKSNASATVNENSTHNDKDWNDDGRHDEEKQSDDRDSNDDRAPEGKKMAFSQFIKQGGSYECTVHQWIGEQDTKGKIYLDTGSIRANFNVSYSGTTISGSAIVRDGFAYTWSSALPTGFKIAVKEDANGVLGGNVTTVNEKKYSWNADQIGDYDCVAWKADQSVFTLPAGVQFTEIKP